MQTADPRLHSMARSQHADGGDRLGLVILLWATLVPATRAVLLKTAQLLMSGGLRRCQSLYSSHFARRIRCAVTDRAAMALRSIVAEAAHMVFTTSMHGFI